MVSAPLINNNGAAGLGSNAAFCSIVVDPAHSCIDLVTYYVAGSSNGVGTVATFQVQGSDGNWRSLVSPAPITLANSTNYNGVINGPILGIRINITGVVGAGASYAELIATTRNL